MKLDLVTMLQSNFFTANAGIVDKCSVQTLKV